MALVLGALSLLGLGIFGPSIANGIVSGGPQLGAGAAIGTGVAAGGVVVAGGALAAAGAGMVGGAAAAATRGTSALTSGTASIARTGASAGAAESGAVGPSPLRRFASSSTGAAGDGGAAAPQSNDGPPAWARRMKRAQTISHGTSAATHALRSGDHGGGGASVDLSDGKQ